LEFKIYTNALKAYENEGGERFVTGTTSSTIRDLHGDEMSLNALKSMADTARQNMTVFLNHNYNVPEDLFGSAMDAQIVKRFDSETGQEVYDLDVNIRVVNEDENPEALRAYRAIKRGVKLGLSIGARVEKASRKAATDSQPESIVIEKVRLMEASVVGIPANQRSYLHNAIKSIKAAGVNLDSIESGEDYEEINNKFAKAREIIDSIKSLEIEGETSPENIALAGALAGVLADSAALYVKAHGAHWNVVGPAFAQYHELFGEIYEDVYGSLDPLAENIRKLNVPAPAEIRELALMSSPQPIADDYDPESLASSVYSANEALIKRILSAFDVATRQNQQGIANFLAERQDMHQKWSWQIRSSLAEVETDTGAGGIDVEDTATEEASSSGVVSNGFTSSKKNEQESSMEIEEKKTRVTVTVSTDGDERQQAPAMEPVAEVDQAEEKEEVKASASPEDTEPAVNVEEDAEAEESEKDPVVEALEALGATLVEAEKSADGENESSVQPETAEAEVVVEAPVEEAPAAENVEADEVSSIDEVKSIAKSALDAANAAHEEVAAISVRVTELAEAKAKVEEDLSKALELIERISALGVGRKSYDRPQEVRVKSPEFAPWLSPYVQRVLEAQDEE
jgi:starvation-inducible DNA-binding protein